MKNSKGITLIKLVLLIAFIIICYSAVSILFLTGFAENIELFSKTISKKIDLDSEICTNEKLLGITDVSGQGIIITLQDGSDMIHQEDLMIIIDELKNAGAEAISVNDIRITNSSYLYCDGSVILLDNEKIGTPFILKAIGNSETLYGALNRNKGYLSLLESDKVSVNIEKSNQINIVKTKKSNLIKSSKNKISKLKKLYQLNGQINVYGNGIRITINETNTKLTAINLLQIINDLKCSNCKYITINGERITNMTDIVDISSKYILINSIPVESPFIIEAIGDYDTIETTMNYQNSQFNKIKSKNDKIIVEKVNNLKINKYENKRDKNKLSIDYLK